MVKTIWRMCQPLEYFLYWAWDTVATRTCGPCRVSVRLTCISHAQVPCACTGTELNYVLWLGNQAVLIGLDVETPFVIQEWLCVLFFLEAPSLSLAQRGRVWRFQRSGGMPSETVSSQPQSLVLWLSPFSWHLIITLLIMTLPLRSGTTGWCSLVVGILRDSKTAGKNLSGKKENMQEQIKKRRQRSVLSLCLDGFIFFFNFLTCSVLCMSESVMIVKRYDNH